MGSDDIADVFEKISVSGLYSFFNIALQEMYAPILSALFSESSLSEDQLVTISVDGQSVAVTEDFFGRVFNLPNEGISSFSKISASDIKEMQALFSVSDKAVKVSDPNREIKFGFQLLSDVVAKEILAKARYFAALTLENQIKTGPIFYWFFNMVRSTISYGQCCVCFHDPHRAFCDDIPHVIIMCCQVRLYPDLPIIKLFSGEHVDLVE